MAQSDGNRLTSGYDRPFINRHDCLVVSVILIGDYDVGKSSIITRFADEKFDDVSHVSMGIDFKIKRIILDGIAVCVQLWDTYGGERYRGPSYAGYRRMHGVMLVYDKANMESFENIEKIWMKNVQEYASPEIFKLVVGNKADLNEFDEVPYALVRDFTRKHGLEFVETSAKTGFNVEQAVLCIVCWAKDKLLQTLSQNMKPSSSTQETNQNQRLCVIS